MANLRWHTHRHTHNTVARHMRLKWLLLRLSNDFLSFRGWPTINRKQIKTNKWHALQISRQSNQLGWPSCWFHACSLLAVQLSFACRILSHHFMSVPSCINRSIVIDTFPGVFGVFASQVAVGNVWNSKKLC